MTIHIILLFIGIFILKNVAPGKQAPQEPQGALSKY